MQKTISDINVKDRCYICDKFPVSQKVKLVNNDTGLEINLLTCLMCANLETEEIMVLIKD